MSSNTPWTVPEAPVRDVCSIASSNLSTLTTLVASSLDVSPENTGQEEPLSSFSTSHHLSHPGPKCSPSASYSP